MRITLVKPNIGRLEHSLFVDEARMEPLQLGLLAGMTPPDIEVELIDDRIEEIFYDQETDLAAITVETFTARRAYEISQAFRQRNVPVILGGMHVTLLPEEASLHADAIFIGDAELLWHQVLEDVRNHSLKKEYRPSMMEQPQSGFLPRRDLYKGKGYLPITLLQFGRGCHFRCEYCATSAYFGHQHRYRKVKEVIDEIEQQERRQLFFVDDNIIADKEAAKALFRALIPLRIQWVSQASLDMIKDRELMDLMVESGCLGNVIGFETINEKNLRQMRKSVNLEGVFDVYRPQIEILRDYGLQTWAAFTLGHDYDTVEGIEQTLDFALENRFSFAAFNVLMPYPNTPLYERLNADNRLLYDGKWWLHPEYRFNYAAFQPRLMSADELTEMGFRCRKEFNSLGSIFHRALDLKTNLRTIYRLGIFTLYSRLFRQETFKKHGMRFGYDE